MMKRLTYINQFSKAWRYLLAALLISSLGAFAQDENNDDLEEVEGFTVVGSNITRLDLETVNPVINITREALDATGFSTAGDAIRALPIVSGSQYTSIDAGTSFSPGVSSVNLRGLGNNNTLALLNGRRVAPFATPGFNGFQNVVDLSSIPASAIESIQILKDGASAVYGSDAVAGVISINLAEEYDGLTTEVSIGNTFDNDSFEWSVFAIGGASSSRASIVYTVDYRERNPMFAREIPWMSEANPGSSANVSANVMDLDPTAHLIDPNGDPNDPANQMFPDGVAHLAGIGDELIYDSLPGPEFIPTVDDFEEWYKPYNWQEDAGAIPKVREMGFYTRMTYAVTDTIDAYLEASFRRVETMINAAPTPAFTINENGNSIYGTINFPATNPYNPFGYDLVDIRWRMLDFGNRWNNVEADTPRIVAGLKGDLPLESWTFDTAFLTTKSQITNSNDGAVFDSLLQQAFDGVEIDGEMLYANPWGKNDPRLIDFASGPNPQLDSFEIWSYDFKSQGDVIDLGDLGVVKAAVGAEYRYEELNHSVTVANETGDIVGGSESQSVYGERDVSSVFAEISVPLTELAEIQLAGRYEDYSDFGSTTKPKIAAKLKPLPGLLIRGAFGQSFRAPDLSYLYSSGSTSFTSTFVDDPLRPDDPPQQIKTLGGGNPDLDPEKTDSYYLGVVADIGEMFSDVEALDGLVFEIDLWKFEQTDALSTLSATQIVANAGDPFWDQFITRNAPAAGETVGSIAYVSTQWQNLDKNETQGVDLAAQYIYNSDNFGEFRFKVETTYVDSFEYTDSFGETQEWAGTYLQPEWRGTGTIAWRYGDWAAALFVDYIGEFDDYSGDPIKSYWRFNPQVAFSGWWDTTITVGVRNVFNEEPPLDPEDTTYRSTQIHNIEPRFGYLRIRKDW